MPFVFKSLALLLSISAGLAADKETPFKAAPAASYASHQSNAQITIGVDPYVTLDKVQLAFGKLQPNQFGILPVLVVIQNDSGKAIRLDRLKVEYLGPNHDRVEATPAKDVRYLKPPQRPAAIDGPGQSQSAQEQEEPAGRMGDRRPRPGGADASARTVGQRLFLFPDQPATHRHHLSERPLRSGHGQRDLLLRTAAAPLQ